jgi:hypothetical protein
MQPAQESNTKKKTIIERGICKTVSTVGCKDRQSIGKVVVGLWEVENVGGNFELSHCIYCK